MRKNTDSPTFLYAKQRHAGPMRNKNEKRASNKPSDWEEEVEAMSQEIDIRVPITKFAMKELSIKELGEDIATIITKHKMFAGDPRLQRIRDKFKSVEDQERFDAYLNDLDNWCSFYDCDLLIPGN